jgi:dihydrofolate reductase
MNNISIIAAVTKNYAIGKNNQLLYTISRDMKRFKSLTSNHIVIMGRKTFESLPNGALPNRKNIVITSVPEAIIEGCFVASSIEDAIELAGTDKEIFFIGGGLIYKQAIAKADKMYLTWIDGEIQGDTFFPQINFDEWEIIEKEDFPPENDCPFPYSFVTYKRKSV